MKRGNNNVFKLSGNLALGGGNQYMSTQNIGKVGSYGASNSNTMKRASNYGQTGSNYGQSYENNYEYDYNKKSGTSQNRKYSREMKDNTMSYNGGMNNNNGGMSYGNSSSKKIQYNYQNGLSKIESVDSYNNKGSYKNTNSYNQPSYGNNNGSYKDVYSNNQNQPRSTIPKEQSRPYQRTSQTQEISKTKSKISQPQTQEYLPTNNRPLLKSTNTRQTNQTQNRNSYQQQQYNDDNSNSYGKDQVKEYDPSTFVMCRQGCGRKFNPDSISKHQKVCKKVFQNKRPEFNVQQQRLVAKDQKKFMKQGEMVEKKIEQKKKVQQKKQNMPKWKAESLGFRAILKANRRGGEMTQQQKKLISQAQQSGMVKCKFCGRSFSQKAAQRHIPFCQTQQKKNAMKKKK